MSIHQDFPPEAERTPHFLTFQAETELGEVLEFTLADVLNYSRTVRGHEMDENEVLGVIGYLTLSNDHRLIMARQLAKE